MFVEPGNGGRNVDNEYIAQLERCPESHVESVTLPWSALDMLQKVSTGNTVRVFGVPNLRLDAK